MQEYILGKKHRSFRRTPQEAGVADIAVKFNEEGLDAQSRSARQLAAMLGSELPVILPGERIVCTRTITAVPDIFTEEEWNGIKSTHYIHEKGTLCNISPDYETTLHKGLGARRMEISRRMEQEGLDKEQTEFLIAASHCIDALQDFIGKYEAYARQTGEIETADVLAAIRTKGASSFREALQLLRVLHFSLWASGSYHNTLGRFDQYMLSFYENDIRSGKLTREEAFELLEEFFLTCNKDSDLYPGMQQGDNGQSIVLGGRSADGRYLFNELSEMCLRASYELRMIDPKINIRVDKDTPAEIFEKGSHLTKIGLGFPQYSNDDVIIPGLIRKGYSREDAHNYVVAACWEFIIPKYAMDIPNIDAVSLIKCVTDALLQLSGCKDFEAFYTLVERKIKARVEEITEGHRNLFIIPAPMMSVLMDGTIERARDVSLGSKYNNYGIHGTGIATAADSLAAIKRYCFDTAKVAPQRMVNAVANNFADESELQTMLRTEAPKMGQDDDYVDSIASRLLDSFDKALDGKTNERGGVYRAGTGTAMYYIWHSDKLGATPDGRSAGEMLPANYSPSLFIKQKGPVSVIKSFSKQNLGNVANGGPLTLEFDQSVFSNDESVAKLGTLVRTYMMLGGHQLQLNTVSRDQLLDAKKNPDKHRNLIVRVWGWSGYFVELDECYQDHVINRIEFGI